MPMRKLLSAVSLIALAGAGPALAAEGPKLGRVATPAEIAAWDISIAPNGAGLPPGSGTPKRGESLFAEKCMVCHGEKGIGKPNDRLVGGIGSLTTDQPIKTVGSYWPYATTLFDYIRRAMPLTQPQSLTNDEVYSLAAYILNLNGLIGDRDTLNARSLPKVKMPNQGNFFSVYPGNLK